jgi:hypothetical protein
MIIKSCKLLTSEEAQLAAALSDVLARQWFRGPEHRTYRHRSTQAFDKQTIMPQQE